MRRLTPLSLAFSLVAFSTLAGAQANRADSSADPFLWLEDAHGSRAMAWGECRECQDRRRAGEGFALPRIFKTAIAMAGAKDRIPYVRFLAGELYNFWQDSAHVRGIWRKTTLASYRTPSPTWTTVLDLDSLAKAEKANWVWQGANCQQPSEQRCLLQLSDGGEDANTIREFDLPTRSFVKNGFYLPKGKQRVDWTSVDTLLVAREWKTGELTSSGYPFAVRTLARGQKLADAVEIYRGSAKDGGYGVSPETVVDGTGHRVSFISRPTSTFEAEKYIVRPKDVVRLPIPLKARIVEMIGGQVIVQLSEDWKSGTTTIHGGGLAVFDAAAALREPAKLVAAVLFEPGARESVEGVSATRDRLLVGLLQNVKGRVFSFAHAANGTWTHTAVTLPDNVSTNVVSSDRKGENALISVAGYLTPSSIWMADAVAARAAPLKSLPARFDASRSVVEQMEATSKDGTKVPYFIVHPKAMARDGSNPTILYAYGGFEASMTPHYDEEAGKLWVEQGGVYVVANILGGGDLDRRGTKRGSRPTASASMTTSPPSPRT